MNEIVYVRIDLALAGFGILPPKSRWIRGGLAVGDIVSCCGILACVVLVLGGGLGTIPEQDGDCPCPLEVHDADTELTDASHKAVAQIVRFTADAASHMGTHECQATAEPRGAGGSWLAGQLCSLRCRGSSPAGQLAASGTAAPPD